MALVILFIGREFLFKILGLASSFEGLRNSIVTKSGRLPKFVVSPRKIHFSEVK